MDAILKTSHPVSGNTLTVYTIGSILSKPYGPLFRKALTLLPRQIVHRIEGIRNHDDALRACFGELLCRIGIGKLVERPWRTFQFREGLHGKPLYAGRERVWFSVTHSGDWVGCAVALDPVGLDIERIRAVHPYLPERVLSPSELAYLSSFTDSVRSSVFIRQWCLKESFLKAKGSGLATRWRAVSIRLDTGLPSLESPLLPFPVRFAILDTGPDYHGAVCIFGTYDELRIRRLSPHELGAMMQLQIDQH